MNSCFHTQYDAFRRSIFTYQFCRAFDTEVVVIAEMLDVALSEVGVIWHEIDGSKLDVNKITLALVSLGMLRDMVCVRACYLLGIWKLKH